MCRGHDTAIFTMLYLTLLTLWFHKTFKSIFLNQSSWPKTVWWTLNKTSMGNIFEKFSYIFSTTIQYATMFPIKNKFWLVILPFYFDLVPLFYFVKWNHFLSSFTPVLCECITTSSTYYHGTCVQIYKLKDFRWWNFDTQFECTWFLISKVTILRSTHLINIYSFWNCLGKNLLLTRLLIIILFQLLSKIFRKTGKTA